MNFHLAISPCPNDTFMFYKFLHDNDQFHVEFLDIEQLNEGLLKVKFDLAKCSVAVYPAIARHYALLPVGFAMGFGNGPLVVARKRHQTLNENVVVAIPGRHTTAFALFQKFFPFVQNFKEVLFSKIPLLVAEGKVDVGLIIHESRFTYELMGLMKLFDLGELWEKETRLPLPLGAIVIKRSLIREWAEWLTSQLRLSICYAIDHPDETLNFCRLYASEVDENVMKKHIELYVNNFSIDPGEEGRRAVEQFLVSFLKDDVFLSEIWAL